jgi:hypothetical protein
MLLYGYSVQARLTHAKELRDSVCVCVCEYGWPPAHFRCVYVCVGWAGLMGHSVCGRLALTNRKRTHA